MTHLKRSALTHRALGMMPILAVILLASCAGRPTPAQVDNACWLLNDHPAYRRATQHAERKWGVPIGVQLAIIRQESSFNRHARPPRRHILWVIPWRRVSSARGYTQALDGTWKQYQSETGHHWASRSSIHAATDFVGWYANRANRRAGIPKSDARDLYLAYYEGIGGYLARSYSSKAWLVAVADKVAYRANRYDRQLRSCGMD